MIPFDDVCENGSGTHGGEDHGGGYCESGEGDPDNDGESDTCMANGTGNGIGNGSGS